MAASVATYSGRSIEWNRMKGNGTEAKNLGWGTGAPAGDAAIGDVNLFNPSSESRAAGASSLITTAQLADTYQVIASLTASAPRVITEMALFDTAAALSPSTTFTGSLTNVATGSQVVGSTTGFPGSGNFYCQVENEVIVATVVDGTHLNIISRGALGSAAAAHNAGSTVTLGGDGGAGTGGATSAQTATVGSGAGGNMLAHANFGSISLNTNDAITATWTDQFN